MARYNRRMLSPIFKGFANVVLILAFALFPTASIAAAEGAGIAPPISTNERVVIVPAHLPDAVKLQVTIMTPSGAGPFPLAVLNHMSYGTMPAAEQERYHRSFGAYYFLSRGYAVAMPMMRGFAGSEGHQISSGCNHEALGLANAFDIDAVVDYMVKQPFVDGHRIVVAGTSFGGWNTLAYGMLNRPGVKGLINFAGGALIANCRAQEVGLNIAAEHFGKNSRIPSLWLYGENDALFGVALWQSMFDKYIAAGGKGELINLGKFLRDTHNMLAFPEAVGTWAPRVDGFLHEIGLPNDVSYPGYLPSEFPPPSHFAALEDIAAVPFVNDDGRNVYRKFLAAPTPRVFLVSPTGWVQVTTGGFDPLARGKKLCMEAGQQCQPYAVDDNVTWVPPGEKKLRD